MSTRPTASTRTAKTPAPDYDRFCAGILSLTGIDLGQYRPGQMERRLRSHAQRGGCSDLDAYLAQLKGDPVALDSFLDRMTINVSELFRNPDRFDELQHSILPDMIKESPRGLKIWSAGCSYGAEVYSLAVLANELAPRQRHELLAADIDERVLARAREGRFTPTDMRNVTPQRRGRWFSEAATAGEPGWQANRDLRSMITFRRMDLLKERFQTGFDLIACRNVVIYFNDEAKSALYQKFFDALRPGGVLFLGSTERINQSEQLGWEKAGTFFYRRPR